MADETKVLLEVLRIVARGGVHSQRELARQLGVSEGLLGQMLEELVRMGYLKPVADGCDDRCATCPLAKTCAIGGPGRVWALTERGWKAAGEKTGGPEHPGPPVNVRLRDWSR